MQIKNRIKEKRAMKKHIIDLNKPYFKTLRPNCRYTPAKGNSYTTEDLRTFVYGQLYNMQKTGNKGAQKLLHLVVKMVDGSWIGDTFWLASSYSYFKDVVDRFFEANTDLLDKKVLKKCDLKHFNDFVDTTQPAYNIGDDPLVVAVKNLQRAYQLGAGYAYAKQNSLDLDIQILAHSGINKLYVYFKINYLKELKDAYNYITGEQVAYLQEARTLEDLDRNANHLLRYVSSMFILNEELHELKKLNTDGLVHADIGTMSLEYNLNQIREAFTKAKKRLDDSLVADDFDSKGLAILKGTNKQVKYATDIRNYVLNELSKDSNQKLADKIANMVKKVGKADWIIQTFKNSFYQENALDSLKEFFAQEVPSGVPDQLDPSDFIGFPGFTEKMACS